MPNDASRSSRGRHRLFPRDNDGDGIANVDEATIYGTDSSRAATDGRGVSNYIDYRVGTNPLAANDVPTLRTTYEHNARGEVKMALPVVRQP